MIIEDIIWLRNVVNKLVFKHHVEIYEVEEVFINKPEFRFAQRGEREGEDVYLALGQTKAGRYLSIFFIYKKQKKH